MFRYWERHPPVADMIAAYLEFKPPTPTLAGRPPRTTDSTNRPSGDLSAFAAQLNSG